MPGLTAPNAAYVLRTGPASSLTASPVCFLSPRPPVLTPSSLRHFWGRKTGSSVEALGIPCQEGSPLHQDWGNTPAHEGQLHGGDFQESNGKGAPRGPLCPTHPRVFPPAPILPAAASVTSFQRRAIKTSPCPQSRGPLSSFPTDTGAQGQGLRRGRRLAPRETSSSVLWSSPS